MYMKNNIKVAAMKTALSEFAGVFTEEEIANMVKEGVDPAEIKEFCRKAVESGEYAGSNASEPWVYVGKNEK